MKITKKKKSQFATDPTTTKFPHTEMHTQVAAASRRERSSLNLKGQNLVFFFELLSP